MKLSIYQRGLTDGDASATHRSFRWLDFEEPAYGVNVLLCPVSELHTGAHGCLVEEPPVGVKYYYEDQHREFVIPRRAEIERFDPRYQYSTREAVVFPGLARQRPRSTIAHSARLPVAVVPYIVDCDSLLATLECGTLFGMHSELTGADCDHYRAVRMRNMLKLYLLPNCVSILYRTSHGMNVDLAAIEDSSVLDGKELSDFVSKCDVMYPAMSPTAEPRRRDSQKLRVVFAGRSLDKGAEQAAAIFTRVAQTCGASVQMIYVGPRPSHLTLPTAVEIHEVAPRGEFLAILRSADLFISPTEYESVGIAALEAAASGCVPALRFGGGTEHLPELFVNMKEAFYVQAGTFEGQVREYGTLIESLTRHPNRLDRVRFAALDLFKNGKFSLGRRNRSLLKHYSDAVKLGSATFPACDGVARIVSEPECGALLSEGANGVARRRRIHQDRPVHPVDLA